MASVKKIIKKFLRKPIASEFDFDDVARVLNQFEYYESNSKGNHFIFTKGEEFFTVITVQGRKVKREYIKRLIDRFNLEEYDEKED